MEGAPILADIEILKFSQSLLIKYWIGYTYQIWWTYVKYCGFAYLRVQKIPPKNRKKWKNYFFQKSQKNASSHPEEVLHAKFHVKISKIATCSLWKDTHPKSLRDRRSFAI